MFTGWRRGLDAGQKGLDLLFAIFEDRPAFEALHIHIQEPIAITRVKSFIWTLPTKTT